MDRLENPVRKHMQECFSEYLKSGDINKYNETMEIMKFLVEIKTMGDELNCERAIKHQNIPKTFPEKYTFLACKSLIKGRISRGIFSEYMGIERTDIDQFLTSQGFVDKTYEEIAFT